MEIAIQLTLAVITAVIVGLVQVAKGAGLPTRFAPLLSVVLGVGGLIVLTMFKPIAEVIFAGLVVGLTACGLYSGVKTTVGK